VHKYVLGSQDAISSRSTAARAWWRVPLPPPRMILYLKSSRDLEAAAAYSYFAGCTGYDALLGSKLLPEQPD